MPRSSSQRQNSPTSTRYARRVPSASEGESRKRAAAAWLSTTRDSTPTRGRLRATRHVDAGYTAFVWLLDSAPIGKVATYAYVNPVVAIAFGAIVRHESLTWTIAAGAVLVLACVAIVVRRESIPAEAEAGGAGTAEASHS